MPGDEIFKKILAAQEEQNRLIYELKIDMGEVKVDLHHHIEGNKQNRAQLEFLRQDIDNREKITEKRFDLLEKTQSELLAVDKANTTYTKLLFGLLSAISATVGILYTIQKMSGE